VEWRAKALAKLHGIFARVSQESMTQRRSLHWYDAAVRDIEDLVWTQRDIVGGADGGWMWRCARSMGPKDRDGPAPRQVEEAIATSRYECD
jgi:hypothetical protein